MERQDFFLRVPVPAIGPGQRIDLFDVSAFMGHVVNRVMAAVTTPQVMSC